MKIAIPKEISQSEQRVTLVPSLVKAYQKLGIELLMEKGAGTGAFYPDASFEQVTFCNDARSLYHDADLIIKVDPPTIDEIEWMKNGATVIGMLAPSRYPDRVQAMCARPLTGFALELLPRISRAQNMDVLSSQATVAGYKAVLMAANLSQRFFPMLTTAAGTIRPASVLVIGAGVAGLQAIATARRLGAMVSAYDIRAAAREQVESLGAKMIQIDVSAETSGGYARQLTAEEQQKQQEALHTAVSKADVVICTAMIPGKDAPKIINRAMVESMNPGAVVVDIAASSGGNCELTQPGKTIHHQDIIIDGPLNVPSLMARDASIMIAKNIYNFVELMIKDGNLVFDWEDPIIKDSVLTHEGVIMHAPTRDSIKGN